jgi:trehalose/maltose hydrolase-like predicted phosphorylase
VIYDWDGMPAAGGAGLDRSVRRRVEALCAAGVDVTVLSEAGLAVLDGRLRARPAGPGRLFLCPGPGPALFEVHPEGPRPAGPARPGSNDKSDAVRDIVRILAVRGVGPGLVLVVGDDFGGPTGAGGRDAPLLVPELARATIVSVGAEPARVPAGVRHLPGGPGVFLALLDEQLRRRRTHRVPVADEDPAWTITETGADPLRHRVTETIFTLGAAGFGTRGSVEEALPGSVPLVLAGGVYSGLGSEERLLSGPQWTGLLVSPAPVEDMRVLDLRTGVLTRRETTGTHPLRSMRLVSVARDGVVALRAEAEVGRLRAGPSLQPPQDAPMTGGRLDERDWARVRAESGAGIAAVAAQRSGLDGSIRTVERMAAYVSDPHGQPALGGALADLDAAQVVGFDKLLAEHRSAWAGRWDAVDVRIPDDPDAQLGIRFALFQLWCNADGRHESAVGARGLSGHGYAGHVFWDTDVFVLPAMVSMDPAAAKAMLGYRLRGLDAARAAARAGGHRGARFPWESASTGEDVTPAFGSLGGEPVPILTGRQEEHVTADVAWAAAHYAEWSGDQAFLAGPGRPLLVETARYWASRCRLDPRGRAHLDGVIGPDEYHESVNDNAYTNVMARWNLRAGADAADRAGMAGDESRTWRAIADVLEDGYDPATGRYEQFAGYNRLEPLLVGDLAQAPVAADVVFGRARVSASQVIKQPDVLMLHHLVPEEVERGSLEPNLAFYEPRTAHGSSLSPAISAAVLARAGRPDEALRMLRLALALDLGDLTGMTGAGLHLATFGGVWQALLTGFAGVRVRAGVLHVDPRLPTEWGSLELRFRCLGRRVRLHVTTDGIDVRTDAPLRVRFAGQAVREVSGAGVARPGRGMSGRFRK